MVDVSEGVVASELAWETLLEGAILPDEWGFSPASCGKARVDIDGLKWFVGIAGGAKAFTDV